MKRLIHFDLDGVLSDFRGRFVAHTNLSPESMLLDEMWARVASCQEFFHGLAVMPGSEGLVKLAHDLGEVRILTAIPRLSSYPMAEQEKRAWVWQHFGEIPVTVVRYARQKADYARPGDVLIDDSPDNIRRWIEKGGAGILHTDVEITQTLLMKMVRGVQA